MSRIRDRDTKPEMIVRSLVHSLGYRFRLHKKELPGKPDLVFPRRRKIIFVHGCFFHMHDCRFGKAEPKTNSEAWRRKREGNVVRDANVLEKLHKLGWNTLVVWECEVRDSLSLEQKLKSFLQSEQMP